MADPAGFVILGVGGFMVGMLIGMALKAAARVAMYVAGLYLASLVALSSLGLVVVNWEGIATLGNNIIEYLTSIAQADVLTSTGAFGTTTILGAIYGAIKAEVAAPQERENYRFFKKLN